MSILATIRPDDIDLALVVHVLGAIVLVGGLTTTVSAAALGWRGELAALRLSYWTLLAVALPGWIVMRIGAQWVYAKENWDEVENEPAWLGIGYVTADIGLPLFLIGLILGGIGVRRAKTGGGTGLLKASAVIAALLLAAYVVAVWAMGGKPD
jgi:hypothetical protein